MAPAELLASSSNATAPARHWKAVWDLCAAASLVPAPSSRSSALAAAPARAAARNLQVGPAGSTIWDGIGVPEKVRHGASGHTAKLNRRFTHVGDTRIQAVYDDLDRVLGIAEKI